MTQTIGINKAITNLYEAHHKFGLSPTTDSSFFTEWLEDFPEISEVVFERRRSLTRAIDQYKYSKKAPTAGMQN